MVIVLFSFCFQDIYDKRNHEEHIDAILLDFPQAFVKVDHEILLSKLYIMYDTKHSLLTYLELVSIGNKQTVVLDGAESARVQFMPLFFFIDLHH